MRKKQHLVSPTKHPGMLNTKTQLTYSSAAYLSTSPKATSSPSLLSKVILHSNIANKSHALPPCFHLIERFLDSLMLIRYGEVVDVNLVRDKGTGKSKGFAFIAYEDQRSTNLAVGLSLSFFFGHSSTLGIYLAISVLSFTDNLNGAQILGRIIRVDHVSSYKKKEEEDEETESKKREERGVCRAFQRGECNRGAACKFSHDEQVL